MTSPSPINPSPPPLPTSPLASTYLRDLLGSALMLLLFIAMFVAASVFVPNFLSVNNMIGLSLSVTTVGIISCTMLFCLASGDFDLSVGSVLAMSGVLAAVVINQTGSVFLGMAAAVTAGGLVGLFNGFIIAQLGANALITTLATMQIVRGLAFIASGNGSTVAVSNENFFLLGNSGFLLPTPVWIMLAFFLFFGLLFHKTIFGRSTLAIGGNQEAARLAGIPVVRTKIIIFTLQGLVAAFAGIIAASQLTSGEPNAGQGLELRVISACVLGGVSLTGGVGSILAVVVGALIMGLVQNAMGLWNVSTFYQYIASGIILLAAVLLDRAKNWCRR